MRTISPLCCTVTTGAAPIPLVASDVRVTVGSDGALAIEEGITVAFSGAYTFGYRDIAYDDGQTVSRIAVLEGGQPFRPGAPTELEPGGPPGTFGVEDLGDAMRVVWRFQASDETREFTIRYRFGKLAVAYDDVVDVNLKV